MENVLDVDVWQLYGVSSGLGIDRDSGLTFAVQGGFGKSHVVPAGGFQALSLFNAHRPLVQWDII